MASRSFGWGPDIEHWNFKQSAEFRAIKPPIENLARLVYAFRIRNK
jgi:hypothetical protein